MNLHELVSQVISDTVDKSLPAFGPELALCITIFVLLLARILPYGEKIDAFYLAIAGLVIGLAIPGSLPWHLATGGESVPRTEIFTGMLVYDGFTQMLRCVLLLFAILLALLTKITRVFDWRDGPDIYTLILGATLGMCLMASANHLLMVFLAVEMASVPSYVLAGMRKDQLKSSEAALKYSIYGAGTAGIMLYGISLVAGVLHTLHLPTLAVELIQQTPTMVPAQLTVLALGGLMIMVGLAFKLSAVPFHFWCPDVFEGASAEVNAFLSVASKAAALALLVRIAIGFTVVPPAEAHESVALDSRPGAVAVFNVSDEAPAGESDQTEGKEDAAAGPADVRGFIALLVALIAAVTCTFGNLAAYGQTNINRLLAYSTIAHAGYMMMPIPAAVAVAAVQPEAAEAAIASLIIYIWIYLFMSLGAFAIVAFMRGALESEQIDDYAGLVRQVPLVVVCFAIILFSLIGLPPMAGFIGKFAIFMALVNAYQITGGTFLIVLLVIGCLNTVLSLFYYLRVIKVMIIDPVPDSRSPIIFNFLTHPGAYIYVVAVTAPLLLIFVKWDWLNILAQTAVDHLVS